VTTHNYKAKGKLQISETARFKAWMTRLRVWRRILNGRKETTSKGNSSNRKEGDDITRHTLTGQS